MIIFFYYMIYLHIDAFLKYIMPVLFKRLGVYMAMLWLFVGAILGFNVCFNHLLACIVKANGPHEIKIIERLRMQYKQRKSRKEVAADSDRFEGLSADIKSALRYRSKTLD